MTIETYKPGIYRGRITNAELRISRRGTPYAWIMLDGKAHSAVDPSHLAFNLRSSNLDIEGSLEQLVGFYAICRVVNVEHDGMIHNRILIIDIIPPNLKDVIKMSAPFQELLNSLEAVGSDLRRAYEHCDGVMKQPDAPTFEKVSAKAFAAMIKKAGKELQIDITKAPADQVDSGMDFNEF